MHSMISLLFRPGLIVVYAIGLLLMLEACPATQVLDEVTESAQEQGAPDTAKEPSQSDEPAAVDTSLADKGNDAGGPQEPQAQPDEPLVEKGVSETSTHEQVATDKEPAPAPHPLTNQVDQSKYETDLALIAQPRSPNTPHWKKIQDLCAARFKEHGFQVELHAFGTGTTAGVNVIGVKEGTKAPKEQILLSAHYDSVANCEGADDNATGVAGVLEAARVLGQQAHDRTLIVACWDQEEAGLLGSAAYAKRAAERKDDIKMHFVFEMIGFYADTPNSQTLPQGLDLLFPKEAKQIQDNQSKGDFIALIGDTGAMPAGARMAQIGSAFKLSVIPLTVPDNLKNSPLLRDLQRSDHAPFWKNNVPAMMITDTSEFRYKPYHCRNQLKDTHDKLNAGFATGVIKITVDAVAQLLSAP